MRGERYTRNPHEPCICFSKLLNGEYIYLLLYVYDMLIASKSISAINKLKSQLSSEFKMKDLREAKRVLGRD